MKRLIYTAYTIIALAVASAVSAQPIMDGQAEVKNLSIGRNGSQLIIDFDIDVTNLEVGADETVILTPTIEGAGQSIELPSVELMGRRAYMYYRRNDEQSITSSPLHIGRAPKRAERKSGDQTIDYTTSIAFAAWMRESKVSIKQNSCGCDPELLALGTTPMMQITHERHKPQYVLSLITPEPEPIKTRSEAMSAYINFVVNKYDILENFKDNATELSSVIESINKVKQDADFTITSIHIEGWASPEGSMSHNQLLSQNRANSLADYVARKTGFERSKIVVDGRGEDWNGLRELVVKEIEAETKAKILAVIDDASLSLDQKDARLKALVPPTIYRGLLNDLYPRLRRNDYQIEYSVRNFNLEEARQVIKNDPSKLSLDEMYRVAGSYPKGSADYNYAMLVAARIYPTAVAAAIDAASIQINNGEWDAALQTLAKSDTSDARIIAAQGYAYAGKGDVEKARTAWEKAAAMGNADAKHNLAELLKSLEDKMVVKLIN